MEQPLNLLKRKRYQFIENSEHDLVTGELLQLASDFAKSPDANESKWLRSAATKILGSAATSDMILLHPSSKGDVGEITNDDWALTSNWVFYTVQLMQENSTSIMILGTMFPFEESSQIGKLFRVKLPEYLLKAKNNVEVQGRNLIAEEAPELHEGEEVKGDKKINVSLYGIRDLDNSPQTCRLKSA